MGTYLPVFAGAAVIEVALMVIVALSIVPLTVTARPA
jgi:hypothetical protein